MCDFLDPIENPFYTLHFRVLRFPITESTMECIITNLEEEDFPMKEIKKLYEWRWGIERSFRELKYTIGLTNFHAKKVEYILQEIFFGQGSSTKFRSTYSKEYPACKRRA